VKKSFLHQETIFDEHQNECFLFELFKFWTCESHVNSSRVQLNETFTKIISDWTSNLIYKPPIGLFKINGKKRRKIHLMVQRNLH
jgi:hypothetical protein